MHSGPMSSDLKRLAYFVRDRRAQLDRTQIDVWRAGGPSNSTLTKVESGEPPAPSLATLRKIDVGMEWAPGSAKAVLDGGDPTPLPTPPDAATDVFAMLGDPRAHVERKASERRSAALGRGFAALIPIGIEGYGADLRELSDDLLAEHWQMFNSEAHRAVREFARRHAIPAGGDAESALGSLLRGDRAEADRWIRNARRLARAKAMDNQEETADDRDGAPITQSGGSPEDPPGDVTELKPREERLPDSPAAERPMAARQGLPANPADSTTGEESQAPDGDWAPL